MAGDWIKMRSDLFTHPKVVRMASALKADTLRTVGGLMSVWCLFDAHSVDGKLDGYNGETLDDQLRWPGFAAAMSAVRWLDVDGESLVLPEFDTHNGASAKRRAQDADRKRSVRKESATEADKKRTREEKRREEEKNPPKPPKGGSDDGEGQQQKPKRAAKIGFAEFRAECEQAGENLIPVDDAVFAYADRIGMPHDFVALAWRWFKARYADKQQVGVRGWRQTFRNAVEGNWPKFWFPTEDGSWQLTTAGKQAKLAAEADAGEAE